MRCHRQRRERWDEGWKWQDTTRRRGFIYASRDNNARRTMNNAFVGIMERDKRDLDQVDRTDTNCKERQGGLSLS